MGTLTLYQILCLAGIPSFATIIGWIHKKVKFNEKQTDAVKSGIQALLRARMISDYIRWSEKKYTPIYARENFQNCWEQYHALGANGVMEDIYEKFMELEIRIPKGIDENDNIKSDNKN